MEVEITKTLLKKIPHEGKEIIFVYPPYKGSYKKVAESIDKANLKRPSSPEVISLLYDAWRNLKGEYESKIVDFMMYNWIWEYTGNYSLPKSNEEINNGIILDLDSQNLKFENGKLIMDKSSLIKRLNENDLSVKFVPFEFKTGSQSVKELEENLYIIARYGKEGAEKIARIASNYKVQPNLRILNPIESEIISMSGIDSVFNHSNIYVGVDIVNYASEGNGFGLYLGK